MNHQHYDDVSQRARSRQQRARQADDDQLTEENEYDDVWPPRMPTSTRRYSSVPARQHAAQVYTQGNRRIYLHHGLPSEQRTATQIPPRARQYQQPGHADEAETVIPTRPRRRVHWLLLVGVGMLVMYALWLAGSWTLNWWQIHQDDVTYGRPRTFQTDAVVGHHDSPSNPSHFIAINLHRHVVIIECPGSDCAHAVLYIGPTLFGDGQDLTPVTLTFRDLNGDSKPDMIVHIQDQRLVFINEDGKFRPARPGEVSV